MADLVEQVEKYLDPFLAVELTRGDVLYHVDKIIEIVRDEALEEAAEVAGKAHYLDPALVAAAIRALKEKGNDPHKPRRP